MLCPLGLTETEKYLERSDCDYIDIMGFGKNNTGVIIRETDALALTTIGALTAKIFTGLGITEDFRSMKIEVVAHVDGLTAGEGNGLCLGIANGELSATEVTECLNADGPLDRNDRLAQERAERFCKIFATVGLQTATAAAMVFIGKGGSYVLEVKPNWTFSNPEGWSFFVFNNDPAALTTGATVSLAATHYGVWLT